MKYRTIVNIFKMPRIDPQQLLKTLGVLLGPHGGIKSSEEVSRLVQLMQKFSRKLVSKCIYIRILKATANELLEQFLDKRGWELLNQWFSDAIKTQNWPLCREMIQLFNMCPISASRLKENVDENHAPKLINQLRQETSVEEDIKALATEVYIKWVRIVSPAASAHLINVKGKDAAIIQGRRSSKNISEAIIRPHDSESSSESDCNNSKDGSKTESKDGAISLLQSLAEEVSENIKKDENKKSKPEKSEKRDGKSSSRSDGVKSRKMEEKHKDKARSHHSTSHEKDKKKESGISKREVNNKHSSSRDRDKDKEHRRYRHTDLRDEVNDEEKQRIKEKARKLKEEVQAKKDKDTLNKVSGGSSTSSLSKIPKIPKKAVKEEEKKKGSSFSDMLGILDSKPTTVRRPLLKNKTAAMLETMTKPSSPSQKASKESSLKSSSASLIKKDSVSKEKDSSSRRDSHPPTSSKKDLPIPIKSTANGDNRRPSIVLPDVKHKRSPDKESPKSGSKSPAIKSSTGFMDAIFNTMKKDEPRKRKRRPSDREDSKPTEEKKNGENDPSPEKKLKEDATGAKKEENEPIPTFSFYRELDNSETNGDDSKVDRESTNKMSPNSSPPQTKDVTNGNVNYTENGDDENKGLNEENTVQSPEDNVIPFEEPMDDTPREVKGILVYHRGKGKRNKNIKWKAEASLVSVRYFELDEDERVNVNKVKFENMREFETKMEKAALASKSGISMDDQEIKNWYKPVPLTFDESENSDQKPCFNAYGSQSTEKLSQAEREKTVLQALYFNLETTPNTPAEPDNPSDSMRGSSNEMTFIPLEDKEADESSYHDYTQEGWPEANLNKLENEYASSMASAFSLPPALSSLLATIETRGLESIIPSPGSLSQEDQSTLAAQTAALQKLGMIPGVDIIPSFPPPIQSLPTTNATGNGISMNNQPITGGHHVSMQKPPVGLDPFLGPNVPVPGFPPPVHNAPPNMSQHAPFGMAPPDHMQDNSFNNFNQHPMQQTPFHNGPFQGGLSHRGGNNFGRGGNHNGFRGGNNGSENFNRDR